jgi:hypothetical protein
VIEIAMYHDGNKDITLVYPAKKINSVKGMHGSEGYKDIPFTLDKTRRRIFPEFYKYHFYHGDFFRVDYEPNIFKTVKTYKNGKFVSLEIIRG